jgi:predicted transcriptional regulator
LRCVGEVETDLIHVELLRALASRPEGARNSAELAETMVRSRQFVAAKLRPLVSAGLVSRRWGGAQVHGRTYMISDEGRAYLMRIDSKVADRA